MDPHDHDGRRPPTPPEVAREAAPDPARTPPAPAPAGHAQGDPSHTHETRSDHLGERTRAEDPPERAGTVTPAPPRATGPDVNDVDRLEDPVDRFLGEPSDPPTPRT